MRIYSFHSLFYEIKRYIVFFIFFTMFEAQFVHAQETSAKDEQEQLKKLQQQIREKQDGYEKIKGKEQSILRELREIDQVLKQAQQNLQAYREKLTTNEEELERMQTELTNLQERYQNKHAALAKRLQAIYKMGDLGYLMPFFAISKEMDMQQQIKYLQRIADSDRQLMKEARNDMQAILTHKQALEKRKHEIIQAQKEIEQQNTKIAAQKQQKTELLKQIRTDKRQFARVLKELEQSAAKLEDLLSDLETKEQSFPQKVIETGKSIIFPDNEKKVVQSYAKHFQANKGKLLWPVSGKIITPFGKIKIGDTYTHYKGVDIRANSGTPFYAVFQGMVKYADWFDGYGNLVIIDHGGNYYTLYAHADEISVKSGDTIGNRQLLGKVGDTDSIKGSHLYFEIRANGKPQDPQKWLAKVR